jgi:hypothetical protein
VLNHNEPGPKGPMSHGKGLTTFEFKYLDSNLFSKQIRVGIGDQEDSFDEKKTRGRKSHASVALS